MHENSYGFWARLDIEGAACCRRVLRKTIPVCPNVVGNVETKDKAEYLFRGGVAVHQVIVFLEKLRFGAHWKITVC